MPNEPWSINVSSRFQGGFQIEIGVIADDTGMTLKEKIQKATMDDESRQTFRLEHQCLKIGSAKGQTFENFTVLRDVITNGAKVGVSRQR